MPFLTNQLSVQFHSVDLCTEYCAILLEENWIFPVKAVCLCWTRYFVQGNNTIILKALSGEGNSVCHLSYFDGKRLY